MDEGLPLNTDEAGVEGIDIDGLVSELLANDLIDFFPYKVSTDSQSHE